MSRRAKLGWVGTALFAALALAAVAGLRDREPVPAGQPEQASSGVTSVLCAAPFELTQPYPHDWSAERALVTDGWLLVLEVDPELARARQIEEPVLQVGDTVAERLNHGDVSGRLIAIVPGRAQLESRAMFFGAPALPEQLDLVARVAERTRAGSRGILPFPSTALDAATDCGGGTFELADRQALLELAAQWILEYSPAEAELAFDLLQLPIPR